MNKIEKVEVAQSEILVISCDRPMPEYELVDLRDLILKQKETGVVMIPFGFSWGVLKAASFVALEDKQ